MPTVISMKSSAVVQDVSQPQCDVMVHRFKTNFKLNKIDSMYVPGPKFLSYHYWGVASPLK